MIGKRGHSRCDYRVWKCFVDDIQHSKAYYAGDADWQDLDIESAGLNCRDSSAVTVPAWN